MGSTVSHPPQTSHIERYAAFCRDFAQELDAMRDEVDRIAGLAASDHDLDRRIEHAFRRFAPAWHRFFAASYEAVAPLLADEDLRPKTLAITETVVVSRMREGPLTASAFEKRRGYPGDFETLDLIYAGDLRGDTPWARFCHLATLEIGRPVANRLELAVADMAREARRRGVRTFSYINVGCGAAPDVARLAARAPFLDRIEVHLVDHDAGALEAARTRLDEAQARTGVTIDATVHHGSYADLLEPAPPAEHGRFDYAYCIGLLDYLGKRRAHALVRSLWDRLAPGGTLLAGNMKDGTANVWPVNAWFDWRVKYRTEEDLLGWADAVGATDRTVITDESGRNLLLFARKPA